MVDRVFGADPPNGGHRGALGLWLNLSSRNLRPSQRRKVMRCRFIDQMDHTRMSRRDFIFYRLDDGWQSGEGIIECRGRRRYRVLLLRASGFRGRQQGSAVDSRERPDQIMRVIAVGEKERQQYPGVKDEDGLEV